MGLQHALAMTGGIVLGPIIVASSNPNVNITQCKPPMPCADNMKSIDAITPALALYIFPNFGLPFCTMDQAVLHRTLDALAECMYVTYAYVNCIQYPKDSSVGKGLIMEYTRYVGSCTRHSRRMLTHDIRHSIALLQSYCLTAVVACCRSDISCPDGLWYRHLLPRGPLQDPIHTILLWNWHCVGAGNHNHTDCDWAE